MKKFLLTFVIVIVSMLSSCNPRGSIENYSSPLHTENIGQQVIKARRIVIDRQGFNVICKDENISSELDRWSKVAFKSYEEQKAIIEYYYVKPQDSTSVYRLDLNIMKNDTTFVLEIRKMHNK